jgi:glucokinase-like ROK family protein
MVSLLCQQTMFLGASTVNARARTGDQALVRDINQTLVLKRIRETSRISRADLSEVTGLNKATVSNIVRELLTTHLIREVGLRSIGTGRPAVMLELDPNAGCIVGAEIGVDFIAVIRTNFIAEIEWRHREATTHSTSPQLIAQQLLSVIRRALGDAERNHQTVFGIAIGIPGLVDRTTGSVLFAPNLGWQTVNLASMLGEDLPLPLYLDNEANMAALGELYFGAARGYKDVLYLSIDAGLGGGIISNERIFTGGAGFAGEFGHISMDPNGRLCKCGNRGCFETLVSLSTIVDYIKHGVESGLPSTLKDIVSNSMFDFESILAAAKNGDELSLQAFAGVGMALGTGLSNLVHAFDPQLIVLGGSLGLATDLMLPSINTELTQRMTRWKRSIPKIEQARHTLDACVMGGIATVYDQIFNFA